MSVFGRRGGVFARRQDPQSNPGAPMLDRPKPAPEPGFEPEANRFPGRPRKPEHAANQWPSVQVEEPDPIYVPDLLCELDWSMCDDYCNSQCTINGDDDCCASTCNVFFNPETGYCKYTLPECRPCGPVAPAPEA